TLKILFHLIELDKRGFYRELGYSSLFDFCTRKLHYSESSAYRRISAARSIAKHPELIDLFLEGRVTLCSISAASKSFKTRESLSLEIADKSKREVEALVARDKPVTKPREVIKPLVVEKATVSNVAPEERYKIQFSVTKEVYDKFKEAKNILSNSLGDNL